MTQEDIKEYMKLNNKFIKDCKRVKEIFSDLRDDDGYIYFANTFYCEYDEVHWHGVESGSYQYYEDHYGSFPIKYLSFTDDELRAVVEQKNKEYDEQLEKEHEEEEEREKAKRKILFETLKREFDI